jgi:hypothetical protein
MTAEQIAEIRARCEQARILSRPCFFTHEVRNLVDALAESERQREALLTVARLLYDALDDSMGYLDATLGPCGEGCMCLLHGLHGALKAARKHDALLLSSPVQVQEQP